MSKSDQAVANFKSGYNCAQAVAMTYCAGVSMDEDQCKRAICAFGGGLGRSGGTCGAVAGAAMLLGLKHGNTTAEGRDAMLHTYGLSRELMQRFAQENGSTVCRELTGMDVATAAPEVFKEIRRTVCVKAIGTAAKIVEELLARE